MWPTATTVSPTLRQLLEPADGAKHPAAGWFAWALSQTWDPKLFSDAALTNPTPFGIATRQWLLEKRNDSQPSVAQADAISPNAHIVTLSLLGPMLGGLLLLMRHPKNSSRPTLRRRSVA
jgi:hypothetical protein